MIHIEAITHDIMEDAVAATAKLLKKLPNGFLPIAFLPTARHPQPHKLLPKLV